MTDLEILQSLREFAVLVDGPCHDVLRATGNDRVSFLHRITAGTVSGIEPGHGGRTLLLDVRGHILANFLVFVRGKSVRLIVPGGHGDDLAAGLAKYAIMDDFQVSREPEVATLAVLGPKAAEALSAAGVPVSSTLVEAPLFSHAEVATQDFGACWVAHGRANGSDGLCVVANRAAIAAITEALVANGTAKLESSLAEALRIAAMEPAPGKEITPDRFPVEVGLGKAINHDKGCYVGQETIVRMRDRGVIRKRLVLLRLASSDLPTVGAKVFTAEQPNAGVLTSAGQLPGENPVALAIVASAISVGAKVSVEHGSGSLSAEIAAESSPWG